MLKHPVLITGESQVKIVNWSKDSHSAHIFTTIHYLEAKPVHET